MLPFQTPSYPFRISYADKILLIGSCFSEEIGNKMQSLKFNIFQNPNGILYDPLSIAAALDQYVSGETYVADDLFTINGLWHSWKHHSSFSGIDKEIVLANMNSSVIRANNFLAEAKILIITFGTAFHYQLTDTKINVANCHKGPAAKFEKKLLTVNNIIDVLQKSIDNIRSFNPGIKIIFTISPVKHIRDGVVDNNWSKARLLDAVHTLVNELEDVYYFPSYELVNDILRDYRFYKSDMAHPSGQAIQFVFDHFCKALLDADALHLMQRINELLDAVNHKPLFKESEGHRKFMAAQLSKIKHLEKDFPFLDFSHEKAHFVS